MVLSILGSLLSLFLNLWASLVVWVFWFVWSPFWLIYSVLFYIMTHGWSAAISIAALSSAFLFIRYRRPSAPHSSQPQPTIIINEILKVLPIHPRNGWSLKGVAHGLRIFQRFFPSLATNSSDAIVAAGTTLLDATPEQSLKTALDISELPYWLGNIAGTVQQIKKPLYPLTNLTNSVVDSDTIELTIPNVSLPPLSIIGKVLYMLRMFSNQFLGKFSSSAQVSISRYKMERMERIWQYGDVSYMIIYPINSNSLSYQWTLFVFTTIPEHTEFTCLSVFTLPSSSVNSNTLDHTSFLLCSLRDHILLKELKAYDTTPTITNTHTNQQRTSSSSPRLLTPPIDTPLTTNEHTQRRPKELIFSGPYASYNRRHYQSAMECVDKLLDAVNATVNDGWSDLGLNKGIHVMKKLPGKNDSAINCVKGSCKMNLPPDFLLRILMDPAHSEELDPMMSKLTIIDNISDTVQLVYLKYHAVWPTSARDFFVLNVFGRLDKNTRVHAAMSIVDPRVPEERGFVRGALMSAGYLIKDCPGHPNASQVYYLAQVDLKGNVPAFIVNKVVESQPQNLNQLKKIAEKEYAHLNRNLIKLKQYEEQFPIGYINDTSPAHVSLTSNDSVTTATVNNDTMDVEDTNETSIDQPLEEALTPLGSNHSNQEEVYTADEKSSPSDSDVSPLTVEPKENGDVFSTADSITSLLDKIPRYRTDSNGQDSQSSSNLTASMSDVLIDYPRTEEGIDFRTMGNQNAARMLEEMFHISELDLMNPATHRDQGNGWKFQGIERDVIILRKKANDSPFHSFIGKGLIGLSPQEVFNCVRNPSQRFSFDSMLKELHVVKQIDEGLYILHMHHETMQCFLKQSRDFCVLVCERSEPNKKIIVGSSVEVPECLPQPNCTRGKILTSGWVIEPYRYKRKMYTQVTYLVQVDMGGVPAALVNFVAKRQPLAIAYLREYLESVSLNVVRHLREEKPPSLLNGDPPSDLTMMFKTYM